MPRLNNKFNPLLKSYPESEKINSVSEGAEVLYVRLLAATDDAGRYWGDAFWVLNRLFTARAEAGSLIADEIEERLVELEKSTPGPLIKRYFVGKTRYLELINPHKQLRDDVSKQLIFPAEVTESVPSRGETAPPTTTETQLQPQPNPTQPYGPVLVGGAAVFTDPTAREISKMPNWAQFDWGSIRDECRAVRGRMKSQVKPLPDRDRDELAKIVALMTTGLFPRDWIDSAVKYSQGKDKLGNPIERPFVAFKGTIKKIAERSGLDLNRLLDAVEPIIRNTEPSGAPA